MDEAPRLTTNPRVELSYKDRIGSAIDESRLHRIVRVHGVRQRVPVGRKLPEPGQPAEPSDYGEVSFTGGADPTDSEPVVTFFSIPPTTLPRCRSRIRRPKWRASI